MKYCSWFEDFQTGLDQRGSNKMPVNSSQIKNSCSATLKVFTSPASEGCRNTDHWLG